VKWTQDLRYREQRVSIKRTLLLLNHMISTIYHHMLVPIVVFMRLTVL